MTPSPEFRKRFTMWFNDLPDFDHNAWVKWYEAKTHGQVRAACSEIAASFLLAEIERVKIYNNNRLRSPSSVALEICLIIKDFQTLCAERER